MANRDIRVCMISGDEMTSRFMQAADVFEPFKIVAEPTLFTVTIKPEADLQKIVDYFRSSAESMGRIVAAVFVVNTDIGYISDEIRVISNGQQFCMLDDLLYSYGYLGPALESTQETANV